MLYGVSARIEAFIMKVGLCDTLRTRMTNSVVCCLEFSAGMLSGIYIFCKVLSFHIHPKPYLSDPQAADKECDEPKSNDLNFRVTFPSLVAFRL